MVPGREVSSKQVPFLNQVYLEAYQIHKLTYSSFDVFMRKFLQPHRAKFFHAKRSHSRAYYNRGFHVLKRNVFRACEMTYKAAGKCIACAGRVKHIFERQSRCKKHFF